MVFLVFMHRPIAKISIEWEAFHHGDLSDVLSRPNAKDMIKIRHARPLRQCGFCLILLNILFNSILKYFFDIVGIELATAFTTIFAFLFFSVLLSENNLSDY
jgi:hypothetical protein